MAPLVDLVGEVGLVAGEGELGQREGGKGDLEEGFEGTDQGQPSTLPGRSNEFAQTVRNSFHHIPSDH